MTSVATDHITLRWYFDVLLEQWRAMLFGAAAGVLLAAGFLVTAEEQVTARTIVSITVIGSDPVGPSESPSRLIDSPTETQLAKSFEVASRASELLDDQFTAREIRDRLEVTSVGDATVLDVAFTAGNESMARRAADAVAQGYLTYRSEQADDRIQAVIDDIDLRTGELRLELNDLSAELADETPGSAAAVRIETDRTVVLDSLQTLLAQRFELQRVDTTAGVIISPALENYVEVSPARRTVMAAGLFGGLLIGAAAAFVLNATSRTVRGQRGLQAILGAPHLGSLMVGQTAQLPRLLDRPDLRALEARVSTELDDDVDTVIVIDTSSEGAPSMAPFLLGGSVARAGRPVHIVVPSVSDDVYDSLRVDLDIASNRSNQKWPAHRIGMTDRVRLFFSTDGDDHTDVDSVLERAGKSRSRSTSAPTPLVWVVVAGDTPPDELVAAAQHADRAIVITRDGKNVRRTLRDLAALLDRLGCTNIGSVTASPTRTRRRSSTSSDPLLAAQQRIEERHETTTATATTSADVDLDDSSLDELDVDHDDDGSPAERSGLGTAAGQG